MACSQRIRSGLLLRVVWHGWKEQNLGCQACQDCCEAPANSAAMRCGGDRTVLLLLSSICALQASMFGKDRDSKTI
jgi:hypothetical protein